MGRGMSEPDEETDPRALGRVIRDPVHNYIQLPLELNRLVDHPIVQRLRGISQTAMCSSVYPAMTGNRFEHSLGSMHLARRAWDYAWANSESYQACLIAEVHQALEATAQNDPAQVDTFTKRWIEDSNHFASTFSQKVSLAVQAAALLHDVGHPPFSHTLEGFYTRHLEEISSASPGFYSRQWRRLVRAAETGWSFHDIVRNAMLDLVAPTVVAEIPWLLVRRIGTPVAAESWTRCLHDLVSGEVDIDRLDYLLRDTRKSGTEFGAIDSERLLQSLEIHREVASGHWRIGFGSRAVSAVESFFDQRMRYYRWVVFHWHAVATNRLLNLALEKMVTATPGTSDEENWLPTLNYFAPATRGRPRDSELLTLSEVDDSTITQLLRDARRRASSSEPLEADPELTGLINSVLHREPNWAPVWKSDLDYSRMAARLQSTLVDELRALESETAALAENQDEDHREEARLAKDHWISLTHSIAALRGDSVAGFNILAGRLLGTNDKRSRLTKEMTLAHAMTGIHRSHGLKGLPDGQWVLAYEDLEVVRFDESSSVGIYVGEERRSATEMSSTARGLEIVDNMRPKFYAFYVSSDSTPMREGRSSLYGRLLREAFAEHFPAVVGLMYRALAV